MPPDRLVEYLAEVAAAFQGLQDCHVEKYEEEILTPERANLRIRVRFAAGQLLEYNEAVATHSNNLEHLSYRYHFQATNNDLIFLIRQHSSLPHSRKFSCTQTPDRPSYLRGSAPHPRSFGRDHPVFGKSQTERAIII